MIKKFINFINSVFSRLFLFRKKVPKEDLLKFRDFLKTEIKITLNLLKEMERFSPSFPSISSFESIKKSFDSIRKVILKGLSRFEEKIRDLDEELVWDGLCIGFFGETNAGKSTLIEALICGDGASIGDGRKDFTREVKHFKYENINLIDMPGIEGKEGSLKSEIEKAVRKAHIVFYIVNSNKEPERETLQKVKNYLNSKAEIYSIINVRLDIGGLRYKKTFEDDNVKKVAERTDSFMKEVFQERYKGYIICHALLGFFAKGNPNREDLRNYQKKAFEILGKNKKTILKISGLDKLENLIKNASKNINAEIVKSNTIEAISELSFTINRILENKKKFENDLKLAEFSIKQKKEEIGNIIKKYEKEAPIKLGNFLDKKAHELYELVSEGIDNEWSEERIKEEVNRFKDKLEEELKEKVKKKLKIH
ncbi:MAG: GTPase domain-containing protein [Candidatus Hydrothermia bacterium]|jgi:tRNA U34 5-carboxymethylaminomethyl modifying GTPase MnmE/TrmE|nr:GTPase domain-containing protein [Candidatus Hydrothermia bacterium]